MPTVQENQQKFDEMGMAQVKTLLLTGGLAQHLHHDAVPWLARREEEEWRRDAEERQRDREERRRNREHQLAYEMEMRRLTKQTLVAAWIAAVAAIIAIFF